ncbi:MAG: hypothetical protein IT435_14230 [Phycisphaerales bacterium]|nr:hypothetical protein [Phycisphaerales bacterium]
MALILAGIDEAGYGPTLGPMCVGLTVWRIEGWERADASPNLWKLLHPYVSRKAPSAARAKRPSAPIAIADSKVLKRPNDGTAIHPLAHLERGVLAALGCTRRFAGDGGGPASGMPEDDLRLLSQLAMEAEQPGGAKPIPGSTTSDSTIPGPAPAAPQVRWCSAAEHWYETDATAMPQACRAETLRIGINLLHKALSAASIQILDMRCRIIPESEFNGIVERTRNKSDVTMLAVGEHVRSVERLARQFPGDLVQIVCDRLGGREYYGPGIEQMMPGSRVSRADENAERSRYWVDAGGRELGMCFQVEAERSHMPVALASMVAKLLRELAMARFNRYWCRRATDLAGIELKPTAGYSTDARRWLVDAAPFVNQAERVGMVRLA